MRVLIISASRLCREGIADLLRRRRDFSAVGTAPARLDQLPVSVSELEPDAVVLDMATPASQAIVRDLLQLTGGVPLVAIGVTESESDAKACAEAGLAGFVTGEATLDELCLVIERAIKGELPGSPEVAGSLLRQLSSPAVSRAPDGPAAGLTVREREVVRLIRQDLSNKEIAGRLGIEVATVKNHVHNLLEKLKVHRRSEAVRLVDRWSGEPPV